MALEPGTLARTRKSYREHNRALWPLGGLSGLGCQFGGFARRFSLGAFAGWTTRMRKRGRACWSLRRWLGRKLCCCWLFWSLRTVASATTAATAVTVTPLLRLFPAARLGHGLRLLHIILIGLGLEVGLSALDLAFLRRGIGKLGLQRGRILLPLIFAWRFAALAAGTHPSAHVALLTRFPSRGQSGIFPFCGRRQFTIVICSVASPHREC